MRFVHVMLRLAVYLRDLTLCLDGNPIFNDDMKMVVNFERMKMVADRVLELHHMETSRFFSEISGNSELKRHLAQVSP